MKGIGGKFAHYRAGGRLAIAGGVSLLLAAASGCDGGGETAAVDPGGKEMAAPVAVPQEAGRDHRTIRGAGPEVVVPEEVKGAWKAVVLSLTDAEGRAHRIHAPLGERVAVEGTEFTLRAGPFLPAFMSDANTITSQSNELENPAVLVTVWHGEDEVDHGWIFRDLAQFNTLAGEPLRVEWVEVEPAGVGK